MRPQGRKTPKACDPCRSRKIKCDGQQPCAHCQTDPSACSYRLRARVRQSRRLQPQLSADASPLADLTDAIRLRREDAPRTASGPSGHLSEENTPDRSLSEQRGVVATLADNTQHIYWGPASSFALAEHIRQSILRPTAQRITGNAAGGGGAHDVTPLLDVFTQRHLFFGTPPPPPGLVPVTPFDWHPFFVSLVTQHTAERFLENFKTAVLCLLPFYTAQDLATFLSKLYDGSGTALPHQERASILAVLAIGALVGTETETGEALFLMARQQNALHEDAVSLDAIQFWLLAAEYQLNIGRATPAYLAIGSACRKAAAMGLVGARRGARAEGSVTAWTLYYYDCWYSIMGGRKKMIALADITHDHPTGQTLLSNLCQLTSHLEEVAAIINDEKPRQLHDLFRLVGEVHSRLQKWGETVGIGTMTGIETPAKATAALFFHNGGPGLSPLHRYGD
ncbi:hypothetical protein B0T11DRAFT_127263 [Plectosphaerella cucumerina]|uniref:Zn(2)-C6 fungal-type domain-containing protein n=1 Tax=Plectosphaerella cucumerina TaxID=40658 RepID=A0A8K0T717_9PEZI|nr:hypothetical protein B0T11DRAFT_127263 [Plectosphaerella cucumerina]